MLVLDGPVGDWLAPGIEVVAQRGGGLDERLAHAFADVGGPALLVGMDTPQVTPGDLARGLGALAAPGVDAVLGAGDRRRLLGHRPARCRSRAPSWASR